MKYSFIIIVFLLFAIVSCSKDKDSDSCDCTAANQACATIVKVAANCDNFGIEVNGQQYPATNIPVQFQTIGTKVCVQYTLYTDMRLCPCCGGTWADVITMSKSN